MKILYGVVGEGMGHAVRSRVVIERLLARGYEVEIMASGRAAELGIEARCPYTAPAYAHFVFNIPAEFPRLRAT